VCVKQVAPLFKILFFKSQEIFRMKNSIKILSLCVVMMVGMSLSTFASENVRTEQGCANLYDKSICQKAKEQAAAVAVNALVTCNLNGASSQQCSTALSNASSAIALADYICGVFPDGPPIEEGPIGRKINRLKKELAETKVTLIRKGLS
jgi:hypothetical protein